MGHYFIIFGNVANFHCAIDILCQQMTAAARVNAYMRAYIFKVVDMHAIWLPQRHL